MALTNVKSATVSSSYLCVIKKKNTHKKNMAHKKKNISWGIWEFSIAENRSIMA